MFYSQVFSEYFLRRVCYAGQY